MIGRGQVHVFESGPACAARSCASATSSSTAAAERRAAPALAARRAAAGAPCRCRPGDVAALEGVIAALGAEAALPPDARAAELAHHLIAVLLLWIERWYDASRSEAREPGDADVQLQRRFARAARDRLRRATTTPATTPTRSPSRRPRSRAR